ncbi:MAG: 4-hydroxy-tetrahydrodipicolinate synthase [Flavobacteriia bacterium]|nr:MAG: 4-hydroxy-tetrahydrodipicolinate synthase [Flavobacteriia bacterium]
MSKFTGTGVAVITPFKKDKSIDYDALTSIINHLINKGVDYLVCLGSTGEKVTLNKAEQVAVASHFIKVNAGRLPLVLGVGGNNTTQVVQEIESMDLQGFDAILSVTPSYNKPSQEGLYQHFKAIAEVSPVPVILYNVPGRTGVNMLPPVVIRLAKDFDNIIGVKEASGHLSQALELLRKAPEGFHVISGEDLLAVPMVLAGGSGVISVMAQGLPEKFSSMITKSLEGKNKEAHALLYEMMPCIDYIFEEGNPAGIKAMMALQGLCKNELRLPLTPVSKILEERINQFILT